MLVVYQKKNGDIIERKRTTFPEHHIGEYTSMGWKILDIKYEYKNKYYSTEEYYSIQNKITKKVLFYRKFKLYLKNQLRKDILFILYIPLITMYLIK